MKKNIILLLVTSSILLGQEVERAEKASLADRASSRIELEVGTEEVIKQKLSDGIITETALKTAKEKIVREEIEMEVRKLNSSFNWHISEGKFYEAWKKKDVESLAKLVTISQVVQPKFFTAWGNYQNFSEIDWSRRETFQYRQVLIQSGAHSQSNISYDWREKFKPQEKIILTIDFDLQAREIQALQEMIKENREKIVMVMLPWGGQQVNNYDNKDVSSYKEIGEWGDKLFYTLKEVAPEVPVYLTVCYVEKNIREWRNAFKAPYDGIALWNISNTHKAPLDTIYKRLSAMLPSDTNIILSGSFECDPDTYWVPWDEAKTLFNPERVRQAGFGGVILMTNTRD